jgi:hypothetical protein
MRKFEHNIQQTSKCQTSRLFGAIITRFGETLWESESHQTASMAVVLLDTMPNRYARYHSLSKGKWP